MPGVTTKPRDETVGRALIGTMRHIRPRGVPHEVLAVPAPGEVRAREITTGEKTA